MDQRFAMVLASCSGEGGASLARRNYGETVKNLVDRFPFWFCANYQKYADKIGDLPVDAHELIALCAPRPTFISYGIPEKGDAKWLDQQGSYMAAVASQPVFRLLGARDMGVAEDYRTAKTPPVNAGLLDGQLAWRQHDGGHTDLPNWRYFIPWADKFIDHTAPPASTAAAPEPADVPVARADQNSMTAHAQLVEKAKAGGIDVYFLGDSIVRRWGATDYPDLLANWKSNFYGWNAGNFGWGGDKTQHILWRLQNGELDGVNPRVIVLLAGTNNVGAIAGDGAKVADITRGVTAILAACRQKAPGATVILTGIFPRNDTMAVLPEIARINENLAKLADGRTVRYLDVNDKLADSTGTLLDGVANERDKLHLTLKGYQVWADALKPILIELLGPPATTDHAPPPTGDPSAKRD